MTREVRLLNKLLKLFIEKKELFKTGLCMFMDVCKGFSEKEIVDLHRIIYDNPTKRYLYNKSIYIYFFKEGSYGLRLTYIKRLIKKYDTKPKVKK